MYNAIELGGALLVSFVINLFIVAAFASGTPNNNLTLDTAYVEHGGKGNINNGEKTSTNFGRV